MLGECLRKDSPPEIFQVEEKWPVYNEARSRLLAIPGHAEYFREPDNGSLREVGGPLLETRLHDQLTQVCDTLGRCPARKPCAWLAGCSSTPGTFRLLTYRGAVPEIPSRGTQPDVADGTVRGIRAGTPPHREPRNATRWPTVSTRPGRLAPVVEGGQGRQAPLPLRGYRGMAAQGQPGQAAGPHPPGEGERRRPAGFPQGRRPRQFARRAGNRQSGPRSRLPWVAGIAALAPPSAWWLKRRKTWNRIPLPATQGQTGTGPDWRLPARRANCRGRRPCGKPGQAGGVLLRRAGEARRLGRASWAAIPRYLEA